MQRDWNRQLHRFRCSCPAMRLTVGKRTIAASVVAHCTHTAARACEFSAGHRTIVLHEPSSIHRRRASSACRQLVSLDQSVYHHGSRRCQPRSVPLGRGRSGRCHRCLHVSTAAGDGHRNRRYRPSGRPHAVEVLCTSARRGRDHSDVCPEATAAGEARACARERLHRRGGDAAPLRARCHNAIDHSRPSLPLYEAHRDRESSEQSHRSRRLDNSDGLALALELTVLMMHVEAPIYGCSQPDSRRT